MLQHQQYQQHRNNSTAHRYASSNGGNNPEHLQYGLYAGPSSHMSQHSVLAQHHGNVPAPLPRTIHVQSTFKPGATQHHAHAIGTTSTRLHQFAPGTGAPFTQQQHYRGGSSSLSRDFIPITVVSGGMTGHGAGSSHNSSSMFSNNNRGLCIALCRFLFSSFIPFFSRFVVNCWTFLW